MALDEVKNFAIVTVSTGYDASATSIVLTTGHGAKLPTPTVGYSLIWWNSTDYPNPANDPNAEIVRCTGKSTDTLTVTRAQEGTSAATHNTADKTYKMMLGITAKMITDIDSKKADLASPTFTGTPAAPTAAAGTDTTQIATTAFVQQETPDASTTVKGMAELATAAETTTGTDEARVVTPDGLAGSVYGKRVIEVKVFDDATALATGDGKVIICIPSELNGYNLVDCDAFVTTVSSSGAPDIMVRNVTDSHDMLSTSITIDANEYTSYTAATAPAINTTYDDVATGDLIAIDVDGAGTGAKGLGVVLTFQLP